MTPFTNDTTTIKQLLNDWSISYNPYSDVFQIYDESIFQIPSTSLLSKSENSVTVMFNKKTYAPLLLEIENSYDLLGFDIDTLPKSSIIKIVEPFISKYART